MAKKNKYEDARDQALAGNMEMYRALRDQARAPTKDAHIYQGMLDQVHAQHPELAQQPDEAFPRMEFHSKKFNVGKTLGKLAKGASKIAGFIPGVGTLAGAALGAGGALLSGEGLKGALKGGLLGAAPGVLKGLAGGALKSGLGGILQKGAQAVSKVAGVGGAPGAAGGTSSLLKKLAVAAPGVLGAIQKQKQLGAQKKLLEEQAGLAREQAGTARGLLGQAAAIRNPAQAALMERLKRGSAGPGFATDQMNPFLKKRRPLLPPPVPIGGAPAPATPYLQAAGVP